MDDALLGVWGSGLVNAHLGAGHGPGELDKVATLRHAMMMMVVVIMDGFWRVDCGVRTGAGIWGGAGVCWRQQKRVLRALCWGVCWRCMRHSATQRMRHSATQHTLPMTDPAFCTLTSMRQTMRPPSAMAPLLLLLPPRPPLLSGPRSCVAEKRQARHTAGDSDHTKPRLNTSVAHTQPATTVCMRAGGVEVISGLRRRTSSHDRFPRALAPPAPGPDGPHPLLSRPLLLMARQDCCVVLPPIFQGGGTVPTAPCRWLHPSALFVVNE